jgi:hypothetical protein
MATLLFFATAARAAGVVSVNAFPQMTTEEISSPPASTTSPGVGAR